jgi:hypothetical protein
MPAGVGDNNLLVTEGRIKLECLIIKSRGGVNFVAFVTPVGGSG